MYESKIQSKETDDLFQAILSLTTVEECYRFFEDLCSYSEILAMTQRLQAAKLLYEGGTFSQVSAQIGISSTTIARINKCLRYGSGGYDVVLSRGTKED